MQLIGIILNLPWTLLALVFAVISIPRKISINKHPFSLVFKIKSFWWWQWLPRCLNTRGMALGNVVLLGPKELPLDLEHELVHVEQSMREPFIHIFIYEIEMFRKGYRNNKYEVEAYERSGNAYISSD